MYRFEGLEGHNYAGIIAFVILLIVQILYLLSLYRAMQAVPESKRAFPSWFVWLMIIPVVGFVFAWIMEPFGIPKSFEAAAENNQKMKDESKTIFTLGLTHMILITVGLIPIIGWIAVIISFIVWIIYWIKVVNFKNNYLNTPVISPPINKV